MAPSGSDKEFGVRLRQLREAAGLTQQELAARAGLSPVTVGKLERGQHRRPDPHTVRALADAFRLSGEERAAPAQELPTRGGRSPAAVHSLPLPPTPLIGRALELEAVTGQLRSGVRLVTLVGPGGTGKTCLALHVATVLAADPDPAFADGVAVVWLAGVGSPTDVLPAIADALGITLQGARPVEDQLIDALNDRSMLLMLDNVEHVLGPDDGALTPLITRLLAGALGLRLLVTSRERLRLRDEWVLSLGGLGVPPADHGPRVEQADAVRLFVDRAQRVLPAFALNRHNRAAVARLCRRLEGLPLAIELAATWVRALTPAELAADVDRALELLTLTTRDMPARHQSMRAALDHSWQLLDDNERCTLARLSVFRGGCEREAVQSITGATLLTIMALIDKSLLHAETVDGTMRYRLHELVRQYATERLLDDPADHHATEARHTQYYAALVGRCIDLRTAASTPEGRATLDRNIDNLRAAWGQAIATHNAAALGLLLRAFWILYDDHGWLHDAVTLFGRAAAALQGTHGAEAVRGHLLGLQSYFLTRVACYRDARIVVEEALAILRASGATDGLAAVLVYYGVSLCHLGHLNAAREYFGQAAELAHTDNDHFLLLWSHFWLAVIAAFWGDYETAERYVKGFLTAFRGHGYSRGEGIGLVGLAEIARCRGQYDQAATHLHDAMRVGSAAHDSLTIGACLCQLGALALQRDELNEARYLLEESAALSRELGDPWHLARALAFLVRVEVKLNNHQAARLACAELTRIAVDGEAMMLGDAIFGFALLLQQLGHHAEAYGLLDVLNRVDAKDELKPAISRLTADLERTLSSAQHAAAIEDARRREVEPWLRELAARQFVPALPTHDPTPGLVQPAGVHVAATGETLSPREIDVLRLIAGGANNSEIAQQLVISLHTVKTHVAHILAKLNVASRTAAALRARELGLP